nr:PASTA domain-containing protein [Euzebyales bacterium]
TVSKGIEQVAVPKVIGDAREDAEAALADRGLAVEVSEQYSDEAPEPGTVIASDVRGGKRIDKGSTVGLTVSLGPLTVSLPGLVGTDVGDAVAELEGLALDVSVTEQPRPWIGPLRRGSYGRVEAQVPDAGTALQRGDRVDLYTFSAAAEEAED